MPSLNGNQPATAVLPMVRRYVQTKRRWSDRWQIERYLEPVEARQVSAPQVGEFDINYNFGRIKREDSTQFADYPDLPLNGRYIRLLLQQEGSPPVPVWHGIVEDTQTTLLSARTEGVQQYKAFELPYLLERRQIRTSWVRPTKPADDNDDEDREVVEIQRVVTFNERTRSGALQGNRSAEESEDDDAETWYFDFSAAKPWSNRDILEYLLKRLAPAEITWELVGETEPLDNTYEVWDFDGASIWEAINQLIKRERGLGVYTRLTPGDNSGDANQTAQLVVYSISEVDISYGSYELPANRQQVFFGMPESGPAAHLVRQIPFRNTATTQYDRIEIAAKRLLCTATWTVQTGNLVKGWSAEEETAYRLGISENEEENDQYRAGDYFANVYSKIIVTREWDCKNNSGVNDKAFVTIPKPLRNAEYDTDKTGEFWNAYTRFERELPFLEGLDYSQDAIPVNTNEYELERRPLLVCVKWAGYADEEAKQKWAPIDRLAEVDDTLQNGHYRPLDNELGVEVRFSPRHYLGKNHFDPTEDGPSLSDPVVDWETLLVTATVQADDPPMIVLERQGGDPPEVERVLRIDVPGAEYWYVNPRTVVDIDYRGERVLYLDGAAESNADLRWIRKDKDKLEAVASFAAAWYGPRRQAIQIPIRQLGVFVPLGSLLTDIRGFFGLEPVRTPVTSVTWDCQADLTLIATGYTEIDYVGLMDDYFVTDEYYAEKAKAAAMKEAVNAKRKAFAAGRIARRANASRQIGAFFTKKTKGAL